MAGFSFPPSSIQVALDKGPHEDGATWRKLSVQRRAFKRCGSARWLVYVAGFLRISIPGLDPEAGTVEVRVMAYCRKWGVCQPLPPAPSSHDLTGWAGLKIGHGQPLLLTISVERLGSVFNIQRFQPISSLDCASQI